MTKTSAHSPVGPEERALVSYLRRSRNEKRIAIAAAITASFALWAAVSRQNTVNKEIPAPSPTPAVIAPQATIPEQTEPATTLTTEMEEVAGTIAEPVLEEADEQLSAPDPEPIPELEVTDSSSENMVYVPGFGWIENQVPTKQHTPRICTKTAIKSVSWADAINAPHKQRNRKIEKSVINQTGL